MIVVVPITAENRDGLARIALSQYLGLRCRYCGERFEQPIDLECAVRDRNDDDGAFAIAHASCYAFAK